LYDNLCGRILALKNIDENILEVIELQGKDKASLRKVILAPNFPLHKMVSTDFLVIPWGIRPNVWAPPFAPGNLGPYIWVETPTGNVKLAWDGDKFASETLNIEVVGDEWCLTGEVTSCFNTCNIECNQGFPEGYSFLKTTGPNAYFEITKIDEHQDGQGRTSFYTLLVELIDQKNVIVQE
jgi:hypothetical protein